MHLFDVSFVISAPLTRLEPQDQDQDYITDKRFKDVLDNRYSEEIKRTMHKFWISREKERKEKEDKRRRR